MKKILVFAFLVFAFSCKKNQSPVSIETNLVCVAGYEKNGNTRIAKYWKNGQAVNLSNGIYDAEANGIAISDTNVYVCGDSSDKVGNTQAVYWNNAKPMSLGSDGRSLSMAEKMLLVGNDIYVVGSELGTYSFWATFWKNGQIFHPADTIYSSMGRGLAYANNQLYIVGYLSDSNPSTGVIWQNGQAYHLGDDNSVNTYSIASAGNDIYVAGTSFYSVDVFTYWENGQPVNLGDLNLSVWSLEPCFIAVSGTDVYIAGMEYKIPPTINTPIVEIAMYWKNSQPYYLTDGKHDAHVTGIKVFGNDVYISGYESNGTKYVAKYWKNGQAVNLSDGKNDAYAKDIAVIHK